MQIEFVLNQLYTTEFNTRNPGIKMTSNIHEDVKKKLLDKQMCYILITCTLPDEEDGKLNVEMSYDGDPALTSYLLQGAQDFFEDKEEDEKSLIG